MVSKFKKKYPWTIAFRLKKHAAVVENILDKDEDVYYTFCGQRNDSHSMLFDSCVVALTNKRIILTNIFLKCSHETNLFLRKVSNNYM